MDATCNCGAIRVRVTDQSIKDGGKYGHICHCINCQKTAGSALATNLLIDQSSVEFSGENNLSCYHDKGSLSGNTVYRYFCKTCGNPIRSETEAARKAGKVILKTGIFGKQLPPPEQEGFVNSKLDWVPEMPSTAGKRFTVGRGTSDLWHNQK